MAATDPDTRARILGNMRAAERDRHRNTLDPDRRLPPHELEAAVDDAIRAKLADAGRKGAASNARRAAALRDIETRRDTLIAGIQGYRDSIVSELDGLCRQLTTIGGAEQ